MDRELEVLIDVAVRKTRLCRADVMRSALRAGLSEVVRRHKPRNAPRRSLGEYLDVFAGLVKPDRNLVIPSRFK